MNAPAFKHTVETYEQIHAVHSAFEEIKAANTELGKCVSMLAYGMHTEHPPMVRDAARFVNVHARRIADLSASVCKGLGAPADEPSDSELKERCAVAAYLSGMGHLDTPHNRKRWLDVPPLSQKQFRDIAAAVLAEQSKP